MAGRKSAFNFVSHFRASMSNPSPRVELVSGLGWAAFGGAVVYASWTMDRLATLNINPLTAPGIVPGVLGAVIALCGVILAARAIGMGALAAGGRADEISEPLMNWRAALSAALCLALGLGVVGRGIPFWIAATAFVFLHILLFELAEHKQQRKLGRTILFALAIGAGTGAVVTLLFQELFLVRLP